MKKRFVTLILLIVVFLVSMIITLITSPDTVVNKIAQYPAIVALLGILWKILQDEVRDQRDIKKAATLALNSLFAGGYYASKIFDKQVEFCEGYWLRVLEIVKQMEREAESSSLIDKANELYTYRTDMAIWLTEDMMLNLEGFEKAIRSVGVDSRQLERLPVGDERSKRVSQMMKKFTDIMNIGDSEVDEEKAPSYMDLLVMLQGILGVSIINQYRQEFMERAEDQ